jgi:DNA-binding transcriptional MerR regulator
MKKNANFITISELSSLTGVHIKSLRYYEQLGVLKPAYTHPQTHYRYYTCSQIPIVHLIQFYVETDIPLSELKQYSDAANDSIRLRDPLFYGLVTAQQKLRRLQSTIAQTEALLQELDFADQLAQSEEPVLRELPMKICYTLPLHGELTDSLYYVSLRHMLMEMQENQVPFGYETGILHFEDGESSQSYVYATVNLAQKDITDDTHFVKIPAQTFHCRQGNFAMLTHPEEYFPEGHMPEFWLLSELYSSEFHWDKPLLEFRWSGPL